jgi:G3E family GTPase
MSTPLTVIGGTAGAGKTTVIRHLLEYSTHCRIVAIVRDLDPLLADGATGARRNGSVVAWPNGCRAIASDDPTATLAVLKRDGPNAEHVVVEADGATHPRRAGGYAYMPGYRPNGMVTIVDASTAATLETLDTFTTRIQPALQAADLVVLNKLDAAGQEATAAAQRAISSWAPSARFLWCRQGRIAPPLIVGVSGEASGDDPRVVAEWRADYIPVRSERKSMIGEQCRSWCLVSDERADARQFRGWVARLPASIMRGDGVVFLREEPQHRHEFMLLGSRWTLERGAPWGNETPVTRIMLVGIGTRKNDEDARDTTAASERMVFDESPQQLVL